MVWSRSLNSLSSTIVYIRASLIILTKELTIWPECILEVKWIDDIHCTSLVIDWSNSGLMSSAVRIQDSEIQNIFNIAAYSSFRLHFGDNFREVSFFQKKLETKS